MFGFGKKPQNPKPLSTRSIFNDFGEVRDLIYWPKYHRGEARQIVSNIEDGASYLIRHKDGTTEDITEHVGSEARYALEQIDLMIDDQRCGYF